MSITKSGIKSFSLYKDCPTPYDYRCYQRYLLGLTTSYKALSLSEDCCLELLAPIYKRWRTTLLPWREILDRLYTLYIVFGGPRYATMPLVFRFPLVIPTMHLYKEIRADSADYSRNFLKVIFLLLKTGMLIIMTFYCFKSFTIIFWFSGVFKHPGIRVVDPSFSS